MSKHTFPTSIAGSLPTVPADSLQTAALPDRGKPFARSARLNRRDAAEYLGVSMSWLDKSRMTGTGPAYIEIGGRVVYDLADLEAFLQARKRTQVSG